MKIAVVTLTRDRLEYTKRSIASLRLMAGVPFDHYIWDNGSEDGTVPWLCSMAGKGVRIAAMKENLGIGRGWEWGVAEALKSGADLVVKWDNDCEAATRGFLKALADLYAALPPYCAKWILSPRVEGIVNQPVRQRQTQINGSLVGVTAMVGGLCLCGTAEMYRGYRFPTDLPKARGWDSALCDWFRRNGGETGYVESLAVRHIDGTDAQAVKYPEYFARKREEER